MDDLSEQLNDFVERTMQEAADRTVSELLPEIRSQFPNATVRWEQGADASVSIHIEGIPEGDSKSRDEWAARAKERFTKIVGNR